MRKLVKFAAAGVTAAVAAVAGTALADTVTGNPLPDIQTAQSKVAAAQTAVAQAKSALADAQTAVSSALQNSVPTTSPTTSPSPSPSPTATSTNVALQATATASSQNTSTSQTANKAIDGVISGYPADYTKEWATTGGGAGSWLKLTWSSPVKVDHVVLYDRPNLNDQVTGSNITFSDGSTVSTGSLNNDGTGVTVSFPARTVTSLTFNVTAVSSSTANVGLSELQVFSATS